MGNIHQPVLEGENLILRPLKESDYSELYEAASDPLIWEQHPSPDRYQPSVFRKFFDDSLQSKGCLVVIEKTSEKIIGSSRYYDPVPEKNEIEIGFSFLVRRAWGGKLNREMKELMLNHAFRFYDIVRFHVDQRNIRSQKAMERIGGIRCESFEKAKPEGGTRTILVYRIHKR